MKAGQLDQRVTVERLQGGFDELGQPLPDTWAHLFDCWAAVEWRDLRVSPLLAVGFRDAQISKARVSKWKLNGWPITRIREWASEFRLQDALWAHRRELSIRTLRRLVDRSDLSGCVDPVLRERVDLWLADSWDVDQALDRVGLTLLQAIARHLRLDPHYFDAKVDLGNSVLRLLHYPPVQGETAHVRAGAHEDINAITLLLGAEEAGLEVREKDGSWLGVNPPAGAMVVNIGDMLQRLTNDQLPSTTHRVVNPSPERARFARFSTPFFLHFRPDFLIETLPSTITAINPNRYPDPITADGYLQQRLAEIKLK